MRISGEIQERMEELEARRLRRRRAGPKTVRNPEQASSKRSSRCGLLPKGPRGLERAVQFKRPATHLFFFFFCSRGGGQGGAQLDTMLWERRVGAPDGRGECELDIATACTSPWFWNGRGLAECFS